MKIDSHWIPIRLIPKLVLGKQRSLAGLSLGQHELHSYSGTLDIYPLLKSGGGNYLPTLDEHYCALFEDIDAR
jgi:hypothetical protein